MYDFQIMFKIWKHPLCLKNMNQRKKCLQQNSFIFWFYNSIGKYDPNWLIDYREAKFWRKHMFNLTWNQLIRKIMANKKKVHQQNSFILRFYILSNPIHWVKSWKCSIYSLHFDVANMRGFSREAKSNISAKFDTCIRDVNVCLIFEHNLPD